MKTRTAQYRELSEFVRQRFELVVRGVDGAQMAQLAELQQSKYAQSARESARHWIEEQLSQGGMRESRVRTPRRYCNSRRERTSTERSQSARSVEPANSTSKRNRHEPGQQRIEEQAGTTKTASARTSAGNDLSEL